MLHLLASVVERMFPFPGERVEECLHVIKESPAVAGSGPAEVADLMGGDEVGGGAGAASGGIDVDEAPPRGPVGLPPAVGGDAAGHSRRRRARWPNRSASQMP
jgi:hypothetical protein